MPSSTLLAFTFMTWAGALSDAPDSLARCHALHLTGSHEQAGQCFFECEGKSGVAEETIVRALEGLLEREPRGHYYLALGRVLWTREREQAIAALEQAAVHFEAEQNWTFAVLARVKALGLKQYGQHPETAVGELNKLRHLRTLPLSREARAMATAAIIEYQLDHGEGPDRAAIELLNLDKADLESFASHANYVVLRARAILAQQRLDFDQAHRDLRLQQALAERDEQQQAVRASGAALAHNAYLRALIYPSPENVAAAKLMVDAAYNEASPGSSQKLAMIRLRIHLHSADGNRLPWIRAQLEDCDNLTDSLGKSDSSSECDRLWTTALALQDPNTAWQRALRALGKSVQFGGTTSRISSWLGVTRMFWASCSLAQARVWSRAALLEIEFQRDTSSDTASRRGDFALWVSSYQLLATRLLRARNSAPDAIDEAFQIQERSRARVLWDALAGQERADQLNTEKIQSMRKSLQTDLQDWAQDLARAFVDPNHTSADNSRLDAIDLLASKLRETAYPNHDFVTVRALQQSLLAEQAMVYFQTAPAKGLDGNNIGTWATVITSKTITPIELPADLIKLTHVVNLLGEGMRSKDHQAPAALSLLSQYLLDPIRPHLPKSADHLIIVPDGPLYSVPFFALDSDFTYTMAPSATIWARLQDQRAAKRTPRALAVVDPKRTSEVPVNLGWEQEGTMQSVAKLIAEPLPKSREEADSIQEHLAPDLQVLSGNDATQARLSDRLNTHPNLIHISAHSLAGLGGFDQAAVALATVDTQDFGLLSADDIRKLSVKGAVVVLAGCETGWGQAIAGEGMLSIARFFQEAGASAVIASLWPVRDDHTAALFDRFYAHLGQGRPIASALAWAQREAKDEGLPVASYAPFVVLGDGSFAFDRNPTQLRPHTRPPDAPPWPWALGGAAGIALGVFGWQRYRRRLRCLQN